MKNEAEYNLDLVRRLKPGLPDSFRYTKLLYGPEHRVAADDFLQSEGIPKDARLVVISPFTGGSAKNLQIQDYSALGARIGELCPDVHTIFTVSAKDPHAKLLSGLGERQHLYVNSGSILNLVALLDKVSLFVGASTGPTHIAAFLGKPVVAVYPRIKNQSPARWGCLGSDKIMFIQPQAPCPQKYGCKQNCTYYDCFSTIDIADMADICLRYLM